MDAMCEQVGSCRKDGLNLSCPKTVVSLESLHIDARHVSWNSGWNGLCCDILFRESVLISMTTQEIESIQKKLASAGFYRGDIDGDWGRLSIEACQKYLTSLMPSPYPWPNSNRSSLEAFYGNPGDESNLVEFTFPYPTFYDGRRVTKGRCHFKVKDSLHRVLSQIGSLYSNRKDVMEEAEDYGGIYNFRPKRGASSLSLHSWGIAIDLDADDNTFRDHWPMKADMPLEIMECFAREGWIAAGAFWGYDAMHFQAAR